MAQAWIAPSSDGWVVKDNGKTVGGPHHTQQQAHDAGRAYLLGNGGGELIIQGGDGKIRQKDTIGKPDPRGTRG